MRMVSGEGMRYSGWTNGGFTVNIMFCPSLVVRFVGLCYPSRWSCQRASDFYLDFVLVPFCFPPASVGVA
jgi:hypothetical protein